MTMYKHHISSATSLSDENDDDDANKSIFFAGIDHQPLIVSPAQWSSKLRLLPSGGRTIIAHSPISNLPPEILIHILKHLHSPRDLYNSLRVSRTWCECSVELLWHKPAFAKFETLEKMSRLLAGSDQTFTYARFIRRLNFLNLGGSLKDDNFSILARCDRLERLTLVNCALISGEVLAYVLPCFPNLVAIDLTGVVNTTDDAIVGLASSSNRLQGINLAGCSKVTDIGMMALATQCPLLRRVKLSGLELITDDPISALAKSCPLLLEIDLNHCELITDVSIRDIWTYSTHMREMRLSHCVELTDAAFPAPLKPETNGQSDVPNPFPSFGTKTADQLPPLVLSRSFEHLRMLDLTACSLVTDDAVEGIISHAPKIRNLVLSKCGLLTDRSVENICRLGRHLHYLHLGHAAKITDRSVRTLARSCTRLRYIDFANCVLLTDMSVFELSALPKLRRVGLVRVNNLTDEAIYSLAERHATLERIHLSYCDQISVMAIHFLLQKLHKLTHLSLTGIPAFRQPELQQFCREPPKDFNSSQQLAFCVYSGKGVSQLRAFLTELFDHITEMNGTDDTEYEEDEYDTYQEDDTPEADPETGNEGEDDEEYQTSRRMFINLPQLAMYRGNRPPTIQSPNPPQPHEFVFQRERPVRAATVPQTTSAAASGPPDIPHTVANLHGATNRLNAQIIAAAPIAGPSRRTRGQGHSRTLAEMLPIIETSPPPSDVASNRSGGTNYSNGAGFFRTYQEAAASVASRSNGALTPDLNFAEIGHGRGAQTGPSMLAQQHQPRLGLEHIPHNKPLSVELEPRISVQEVTSSSSHVSTPIGQEHAQALMDSSNTSHHSPGRSEGPVVWPYHEPASPTSPATTEWQESALDTPVAEGREGEGRGRSVKRSFRNTLNVAEHYASSLLFGRSSTMHEDGSGPSNGGGGTAQAR